MTQPWTKREENLAATSGDVQWSFDVTSSSGNVQLENIVLTRTACKDMNHFWIFNWPADFLFQRFQEMLWISIDFWVWISLWFLISLAKVMLILLCRYLEHTSSFSCLCYYVLRRRIHLFIFYPVSLGLSYTANDRWLAWCWHSELASNRQVWHDSKLFF